MAGTILENLSNRKLAVVLSVILVIQFISFYCGAFIAPAPANTEQVTATLCIADNYDKLAIPNHKIEDGLLKSKNCQRSTNGETSENKPIIFAMQIPLPRSNHFLDYSRWMSNLIALITPDIFYRSLPYTSSNVDGDVRFIKGNIGMNITLAAKDAGDDDWKVIAAKSPLKRTLNCQLFTPKLEDEQKYECDLIHLFELQSLFYDYYLINIQIVSHPELTHAQLTGLNLAAIHQNGGFTKVWLSLKTIFFFITLLTLIWYWNRLQQLTRKTTLLERTIIMLGLAMTQLNLPIEFLSLFYDLGFMNFLSDVRQGILYCGLLSFWCIFTGEHLLDGIQRSCLSYYVKQLSIILSASTALFLFDSIERGIQWIDPFFTIWEVDSHLAVIFIISAIIAATTFFFFLCYQVWLVKRTLSSKQSSLPSMSTTRRLVYQGIIYRFKFLLWATLICAGITISAFITNQFVDENFHWEDESPYIELQWTSAMYTSVYGMWNNYVIILLILYAPSHKDLGQNFDNLSEEIEFNRLTSDDLNEDNGEVSSIKEQDRGKVSASEDKSHMSLLQELANKQSID